jgi:hypothetical protein
MTFVFYGMQWVMAFRNGYDYGQDGPYVQYYENILA